MVTHDLPRLCDLYSFDEPDVDIFVTPPPSDVFKTPDWMKRINRAAQHNLLGHIWQ